METIPISLLHLGFGLLLMLIPAVILYYYRTRLVKDMTIALVRMLVQLFLVGFYLKYLFYWNHAGINIAWLLLMICVCCFDLKRRTRLSLKVLFVPVFISVFISLSFIAFYFLKVVLRLENMFESRYFIPICGILLGNVLSSNVMALQAFYGGIEREQQQYYYLLCNGATMAEAQKPFISAALIKAFNPSIANMAVMGLIALPGTMVGQILGGSLPEVSIRYQIMIVVIIFTCSIITVLGSIYGTSRVAFDKFGRLKEGVLKV